MSATASATVSVCAAVWRSPTVSWMRRIETCAGDKLTNVAYGGPGRTDLYVLDGDGRILVAHLPVPGLTTYAQQ